MSNELKPCLRCNQKPVKRPRFLMGYAGDGIKCACGIETPVTLTGDAAVEWWNDRPEEKRIKAEGILEAIRHANKAFASDKYPVKEHIGPADMTVELIEYVDKLEGK